MPDRLAIAHPDLLARDGATRPGKDPVVAGPIVLTAHPFRYVRGWTRYRRESDGKEHLMMELLPTHKDAPSHP